MKGLTQSCKICIIAHRTSHIAHRTSHIALFCLLLLISLLLSPPPSQAITITTDSDTNLGTLKSGESLTFDLQADDYTAESVSKITWTVKANSKYNPGFTLSPKKGTSVKLKAKSLQSLKKAGTTDGTFSVTVTVRDTDATTDSITFTGKVFDAPVIKTKSLPKATAGSGKVYNAKLELSSGSEPLTWEISGDLPSGLTLTKESKSGKDYYLIAGEPEEYGTYPLTLTVSNEAGSATRDYSLQVSAVAPKIKAPSGFAKKIYGCSEQRFFD